VKKLQRFPTFAFGVLQSWHVWNGVLQPWISNVILVFMFHFILFYYLKYH